MPLSKRHRETLELIGSGQKRTGYSKKDIITAFSAAGAEIVEDNTTRIKFNGTTVNLGAGKKIDLGKQYNPHLSSLAQTVLKQQENTPALES